MPAGRRRGKDPTRSLHRSPGRRAGREVPPRDLRLGAALVAPVVPERPALAAGRDRRPCGYHRRGRDEVPFRGGFLLGPALRRGLQDGVDHRPQSICEATMSEKRGSKGLVVGEGWTEERQDEARGFLLYLAQLLSVSRFHQLDNEAITVPIAGLSEQTGSLCAGGEKLMLHG